MENVLFEIDFWKSLDDVLFGLDIEIVLETDKFEKELKVGKVLYALQCRFMQK